MFNLIQKSVAVLALVTGLSVLTVGVASATSPCPHGNCNLQYAPQSCKRVEVVGAPIVNLRSSNQFHNRSNVIGVTYRNDVFKLKRCTKKGCKIILKTDQGPVGAWIHSNYLSCTRKRKYQQCGLYSVSGGGNNSYVHHQQSYGHGGSHTTTWTNQAGNFRLSITRPNTGYGHGHYHHKPVPSRPAYGQLYINFNIGASLH